MGAEIKKITKKGWFYFLGAGGIAAALFAKMFLGGTDIISLLKLEAEAKNAITQGSGVAGINTAQAQSCWTPPASGGGGGGGDGGDGGGGGGGGGGGDCDSDDGDGCSDSGSY